MVNTQSLSLHKTEENRLRAESSVATLEVTFVDEIAAEKAAVEAKD